MESGIFHTTYRADMGLRRTYAMKVRLVLFLLFMVAFPFFANRYFLTLANQVGIATIGAIGLNILVGYTGQISLGQGGFMAVGAYTAGILTARFGFPWYASTLAACLVTALIGALFGIPSLRLKGLYLAIATLGFGLAVPQLVLEPFERLRVFHEHAFLCASSDANHDRHRGGQAKGARAGDDQHGDGIHDRVGEAGLGSPDCPCGKREHSDRDDRGNEPGGNAIGEPLDGSAGALRLTDQLDDLREHGFAAHAFGAHHKRSSLIHGGAHNF